MALKAKILGREALTKKLNALAPKVADYAATEKLAIAEDVAERIAVTAPRDTGDYADSIEAGRLADNPGKVQVGVNQTKDKDATGVFADYIWRFLEFGTQAAEGHAATPAQAHIFPTWRAMKKSARRRLLAAVNKGAKEAMGK